MAERRHEYPDKEVELWCEDEARLGLKPVVRRAWALAGARPTSNGRHKLESLFVYGFAHPRSGRNRLLILPKANADCMGRALADFAGGSTRTGARYSSWFWTARAGTRPRDSECRPTWCSIVSPVAPPELQPAEHLWPLIREGLANRVFDDLDGLTATLTTRCQWLMEHSTVVAGAVGFHWAVAA